MNKMREEMAFLRLKQIGETTCEKNKQLRNQLQQTQGLLQAKDIQIATLETSLGTMAHLSLEEINYRQPLEVYSLFFKEQWCQFHINMIT